MLGRAVWLVIALTSGIRVVGIWRGFFWQDDYIHIWRAWNAPAGELIWQNWNGHREPLSYLIQWLLARLAPQVWWPAALVLSAIAVATSVAFWLMLRKWGGVTPATAAAAMLFAAWPATFVAQQWLSAGLETVPLLLILIAGWLLAAPTRWTPLAVAGLAVLGWGFHERALYFLPVLVVVAFFFGGHSALRRNAASWFALAAVTAAALWLRAADGLPGQDAGGDWVGALWNAGPGSVMRSLLGWLPFQAHTVVPTPVGLLGVVVIAVWMAIGIALVTLQPRSGTVILVAGVGMLMVEVGAFLWLRGGFAGSMLASDPRFTLITGVVLLVGLGSLRGSQALVGLAGAIVILGCWSILAYPTTPGRDWFRPLPSGAQLTATPSPPEMLGHFFFTTSPPVYELGTTRTLLQIGPEPAAFPEVTVNPVQVDESGAVVPLTFTPLLTDQRRQCGLIEVPHLDAGVRVVELDLVDAGRVNGVQAEGRVYVLPAPGSITITIDGTCTRGVVIGIPGR